MEKPIEETAEGIDLKKYLDADYPLLAKFKSSTPGTYRHCQNVSALVEAVASDLGLDVTFMKVCATYHDIGKMVNPKHFTENQDGDGNPHDGLDPLVSYQYITRHVSDSVLLLLNETDLPREILEVISQHHGDSTLRSIFNKVDSTNEDAFRYRSPKPQTEEASILMIVDSVEATARSIADKLKTPEAKIKVVKDTIDKLRDDMQLDNMKVGVLRQVQNRLIRELDGIYHTRLDYDDDQGDQS